MQSGRLPVVLAVGSRVSFYLRAVFAFHIFIISSLAFIVNTQDRKNNRVSLPTLWYNATDTILGLTIMSEIFIMGSHRWRLNELMARYLIRTSDLADQLECTAQSIGNLKNRVDMPRLDGDRLVKLCDALNILISRSGVKGVVITPADLIEYHWKNDKSGNAA